MADCAISAVVLCGGGGSRVDGADKPLLELRGRPLVAHVLTRLGPQVDEIVISANRNLDRYRTFGPPVVTDRETDLGPLGGVAAALTRCRCPLLFVCAGDAPCLPEDLVRTLGIALRDAGDETDAAIPHDGIREQPLFMLVRRAAAETVTDYLAGGSRSVLGWLDHLRVVRCRVNDPAAFTNINTLADLEALEVRWQSERS